MAEAQASAIIEAPVEAVWDVVRDFNALPKWNPALSSSEIEGGRDSDAVGCVRVLRLGEGLIRERLLSMDDSRYSFAYNFETPAFPVENYISEFELIPVTSGDRTFAVWRSRFDERPEDAGRYVEIISRDVFGGGLRSLSDMCRGRPAPEGATRWQGFRPAKVFCSSVIAGPVEDVWARMRDFSSMGEWHPEVADMAMLDGASGDKISGVRDFRIGGAPLQEQLTMMCDRTRSFRYKINVSENPWLNYHAGVRLYPITSTGQTFAVWTADWVAAPNDDVRLIPSIYNDVFQTAFDTLDQQFRRS